jgi:hypothetical protein
MKDLATYFQLGLEAPYVERSERVPTTYGLSGGLAIFGEMEKIRERG